MVGCLYWSPARCSRPRPQVIHTELSRLAKRQSPPSNTAPQNPRHDPVPLPSPACVGESGCAGTDARPAPSWRRWCL